MPHGVTFDLFIWPVLVSLAGLVGAWMYGGTHAALIVALLIALETSVSFDNAVINAAILRRLSPRWRTAFLTVGVFTAVFVMRVVFPLAIVAIATGRSLLAVGDQALHAPEAYARDVEAAAPMIGAFGGIFLLLLALSFLLEPERERRWIAPVERWLGWMGRLPNAAIIVACSSLLLTARLVASEHRQSVLVAGLVALLAFLLIRGFRTLMESSRDAGAGSQLTGSAGLASFLYLETIDASFSLDGVLGAFAITSDIVIIGIGLGAGALYVRSLTLYLVRQHALRQLPYLTHGAHWAIGALGVFLLIGIERHPPEWLTGGIGLSILIAAFISSLIVTRHE
jgi:hypothetical protein